MQQIDKSAWLASISRDCTFADVGGLWGTVNEMASVALQAGAAHATMIDIQHPGNNWWQAFDDRMAGMGLSNYSCIHADATLEGFRERVGVYDVVHCSGMIHHLPDPFTLILNLRRIAREHLILTSMYIPDVIKNDAGRLDLRGGGIVLAHAMTDLKKRAVMRRHFETLGLQVGGITAPLTEPLVLEDGRGNTSPWWWLMTPPLLRSMLEIAGFDVIDEGDSWTERSRSFLCKVKAG